jgi:hypothetical protein
MVDLAELINNKSIYTLFKYDLQAKPDSTFRESKDEVAGKRIKRYYKKLDYKECDIFDELEIIPTDEGCQNVILRGQEPADGNELCKIVMDITRELHMLFGADDKGKGIFAPGEINTYNSGIFERRYMTKGKHNPYISLYTKDKRLCLSISGVDTNKYSI